MITKVKLSNCQITKSFIKHMFLSTKMRMENKKNLAKDFQSILLLLSLEDGQAQQYKPSFLLTLKDGQVEQYKPSFLLTLEDGQAQQYKPSSLLLSILYTTVGNAGTTKFLNLSVKKKLDLFCKKFVLFINLPHPTKCSKLNATLSSKVFCKSLLR